MKDIGLAKKNLTKLSYVLMLSNKEMLGRINDIITGIAIKDVMKKMNKKANSYCSIYLSGTLG